MRSLIAAVVAFVVAVGAGTPAVAGDGAKRGPYCPAQMPREAADQRFDAARLVGLRMPAARELANRHGCSVRVVKRNGEFLIVTQEYSAFRINVATRNRRITRIMGIY